MAPAGQKYRCIKATLVIVILVVSGYFVHTLPTALPCVDDVSYPIINKLLVHLSFQLYRAPIYICLYTHLLQ